MLASSLSLDAVLESDSWVEPSLYPGLCSRFSSADGPAAEPKSISCLLCSEVLLLLCHLKFQSGRSLLTLCQHSQDLL